MPRTRRLRAGCGEQEVPAAGQETRKLVPRFAVRGIEPRHRARRSAAFRHRVDRAARSRREEDRAVRAPRPAADAVRVAEHGHRAARDVHPLQLAAREERDTTAVGRPERKRRAFGVGSGWTVPSSERIHSCRLPCRRAVNTSCSPLGDTTGQSGQSKPERLWQRDVETRTVACGRGRRGPHDQHHGGERDERKRQRGDQAAPSAAAAGPAAGGAASVPLLLEPSRSSSSTSCADCQRSSGFLQRQERTK